MSQVVSQAGQGSDENILSALIIVLIALKRECLINLTFFSEVPVE